MEPRRPSAFILVENGLGLRCHISREAGAIEEGFSVTGYIRQHKGKKFFVSLKIRGKFRHLMVLKHLVISGCSKAHTSNAFT